jgi:MFS family permease
VSTARRLTAVLFTGSALGATGYIAAITVSSIAGSELGGSDRLAGVPGAAAVLGTALGAALLGGSVGRLGRRPGLIAGYGMALAGATASGLGVMAGSYPLLLAGMFVLGIGNAGNQQARFAAADLAPPGRRSVAIGWIVWAGTIGSVLGPGLVAPAGSWAEAAGAPDIAGAFAVTAAFTAAAGLLYLVALRPDPARLAVGDPLGPGASSGSAGSAFALPRVRLALLALVVGQVVMVMVMTATPLHLRHEGHGLGWVGLVLSAHTLGMFAFSPLTGRLSDGWGPAPVVLTGQGLLGLSAILAAFAPGGGRLQVLALFLLGLGWNFGFVAASALLTSGLPLQVRPAVQGRADAVVWASSAAASVSSGLVLDVSGYAGLGIAGALLVVAPAVALAVRRRELVAA